MLDKAPADRSQLEGPLLGRAPPVPVVRVLRVVRVLPGEDRLDRASRELGLSDRSPQDCLRLLRLVDTDHDPSGGCRLVAHRRPPGSFRHGPSFPAARRSRPLWPFPLTRFAPLVPPSAAHEPPTGPSGTPGQVGPCGRDGWHGPCRTRPGHDEGQSLKEVGAVPNLGATIVRRHQRGVVLRFGKPRNVRNPGILFMIQLADRLWKIADRNRRGEELHHRHPRPVPRKGPRTDPVRRRRSRKAASSPELRHAGTGGKRHRDLSEKEVPAFTKEG